MMDPPIWFQSFCICEVLFQLPFFFPAAYAFLSGYSESCFYQVTCVPVHELHSRVKIGIQIQSPQSTLLLRKDIWLTIVDIWLWPMWALWQAFCLLHHDAYFSLWFLLAFKQVYPWLSGSNCKWLQLHTVYIYTLLCSSKMHIKILLSSYIVLSISGKLCYVSVWVGAVVFLSMGIRY